MKKSRVQYLIIGDSHIPERARAIPDEIRSEILQFVKNNGKFDKIFCTGDLVSGNLFLNFLKQLADSKDILIVQGNMDFYEGRNNPLQILYEPDEIINSMESDGDFKICLIHGHIIRPRGDIDRLYDYAKKIDGNIKILISGHTHKDYVGLKGNMLLLNPGSVVGAWSFIASGIPSYIILEIINKSLDSSKRDLQLELDISLYKLRKSLQVSHFKVEYSDKKFQFDLS